MSAVLWPDVRAAVLVEAAATAEAVAAAAVAQGVAVQDARVDPAVIPEMTFSGKTEDRAALVRLVMQGQ
jgi:hypothetical protein